MARATFIDRFEFERALWGRGLTRVAGVDEAGRGPLAGPVVAAAAILPPKWVETGLPRELERSERFQATHAHCSVKFFLRF